MNARHVASVLVILLFAAPALAVPAAPRLHALAQPDGTVFEALQWGDEFSHGWETPAGYTIVHDAASGFWVYAVAGEEGRLEASAARAGIEEPPPGATAHLRPASRERTERRASALGMNRERAVTPTGNAAVPVLLVNFSDRSTTYSTTSFRDLLFAPGAASMKAYYEEVSYGKFTVSAGPSGVGGWYRSSKGHDEYGANDGEGDDLWPGDLVYEAVAAADPSYNFAPYDLNGDCFVDSVTIVHQGSGEENSGVASDIWSHAWSLNNAKNYGKSHYGAYTTNDPCVAGGFVKVNAYVIQPELQDGQLVTVGVFVHEYGHALGLPDLYDTDGSSNGVGRWSVMAGGSWAGVTRPGDRPVHFDAWGKAALGWVTPTKVTSTLTNEAIQQASTAADVYQFLTGTPGQSGEYFLLENRQRAGFDAALPGFGLLVWHVDEGKQTNKEECYPGGPSCASQHYRVALVQADGLYQLEKKENRGDEGDPFPGSSNRNSLSGSTTPSSALYSGQASGVSITAISAPAATMTATLSVGGSTGGTTVTVFSETFESSFPGSWQLYPTASSTTWGRSTHRKAGGAASVWCAGGGSQPRPAGGTYLANMGNWLIYGPFSLADATAASLDFDLWKDTEENYDYVKWMISINGSNFHGYQSSGRDATWKHVTMDFKDVTAISAVGASQVWIGFYFGSDESLQYEGAYIDNVVIRKTTATAQCTYSISPTSQSFSASGGNGTVAVTAAAGCSWTGSSGANWITITGGASGSGNGTLAYNVTSNPSTSSRSGSMTIAGKTFSVSQSGSSCTVPSITSQPTSRTISSGQSTTLSVSATGTSPLSYQWYRGSSGSTAQPISGATSASYATGALTTTATYWVRVSNACGNTNSSTATVTVTGGGGGSSRLYVVPALAHLRGSPGTDWRTDVAIVNAGASAVSLTLTSYDYTSGAATVRSASLAAGETREWEDILVSLFGLATSAAGKSVLHVSASAPVAVSTRTYNRKSATETFGQSYPALVAGRGILAGERGVLAQLKQTSAFRTNVGFVNLGAATCEVRVTLHRRTGASAGSRTYSIGAGRWLQVDQIFNAVSAGTVDLGYAVVEVLTSGGQVWAYASIIDQATGDPTTIEAVVQ